MATQWPQVYLSGLSAQRTLDGIENQYLDASVLKLFHKVLFRYIVDGTRRAESAKRQPVHLNPAIGQILENKTRPAVGKRRIIFVGIAAHVSVDFNPQIGIGHHSPEQVDQNR